jgi:hypothetical protein
MAEVLCGQPEQKWGTRAIVRLDWASALVSRNATRFSIRSLV